MSGSIARFGRKAALENRPRILVVAGPNGAGKSTIAREVLLRTFGIEVFVNADAIAAGLSVFAPERAAFAAGRLMLERLRELASAEPKGSFAFESTLSSRTFAPWLEEQIARGFEFHLVYVYLKSPEMAIDRVKKRVEDGGHAVADEVVRRRYRRSIVNVVNMYMPLAERSGSWTVLNNSLRSPKLIAACGTDLAGVSHERTIYHNSVFAELLGQSRDEGGSRTEI